MFLPGGMGVNFVKQFRQAGLADKVKFLSAFTVDESTLPAQKEAALGFFGGANWAPDMKILRTRRSWRNTRRSTGRAGDLRLPGL